ncbi:MAG: hypothetical protein GEU79_12245, partial [Acidimicrobiia bacterium]|nr:hypothetical protein [Acidimicrobiia bacterium]
MSSEGPLVNGPGAGIRRSRLQRIRDEMSGQGVDRLLLSIGPDMPYLIGYEAMATERLTMLVVDHDSEPVLVIPELEAPRVEPGSVDVAAWGETDDPLAMVADRCGSG